MEICVNTGRIADAIADPDKTGTIGELIKEGAFYGMQTFDQHLVALIRDGVITLDAAMARLDQPARPHGRAAPPGSRRLSGLSGTRQPVTLTPCSTQRAVQPVGSTCTTIRRRHLPQYRGGSMPRRSAQAPWSRAGPSPHWSHQISSSTTARRLAR